MLSRNGFSLTFLLASVLLLVVMMTPATRAECDCNKPENEQRTGLDKLLHKTICGVKGAAKVVTDKVKDGYHYVQEKLSSSDSMQPQDMANGTVYDVDLRFGNTEDPIKLAN